MPFPGAGALAKARGGVLTAPVSHLPHGRGEPAGARKRAACSAKVSFHHSPVLVDHQFLLAQLDPDLFTWKKKSDSVS
jgi:hypothetical protein